MIVHDYLMYHHNIRQYHHHVIMYHPSIMKYHHNVMTIVQYALMILYYGRMVLVYVIMITRLFCIRPLVLFSSVSIYAHYCHVVETFKIFITKVTNTFVQIKPAKF